MIMKIVRQKLWKKTSLLGSNHPEIKRHKTISDPPDPFLDLTVYSNLCNRSTGDSSGSLPLEVHTQSLGSVNKQKVT